MKIIKKNQIIIVAIAIMLIVAGYLNSYYSDEDALLTASKTNENFGDASLVNANVIINEDTPNIKETNQSSISSGNLERSDNDSEKDNTIQTNSSNNDYYINAKLDRENMYSQQLESYLEMAENEKLSDAQRQKAQDEIKSMNEIKNAILISENLIKAKGFKDVVVLVNGESINVIIRADKLSEQEVAQIQNIITREFKSKIENIHIMSK